MRNKCVCVWDCVLLDHLDAVELLVVAGVEEARVVDAVVLMQPGEHLLDRRGYGDRIHVDSLLAPVRVAQMLEQASAHVVFARLALAAHQQEHGTLGIADRGQMPIGRTISHSSRNDSRFDVLVVLLSCGGRVSCLLACSDHSST